MNLSGKKLAFNSLGYVLSNFINRALPFFLLPVLTHYLSTSQLGVVSIYQSVMQFMIPCIGLGLAGIVSVDYVRKSSIEVSSLILESLLAFSAIAFVLLLITLHYGSQLESYFSLTRFYIYSLPLVALSLAFLNLFVIFLQMNQKVLGFAITKLSISIFELGLVIILVVFLLRGEEGRLDALIYTNLCAGLFVILVLLRKSSRGSIRSVKEMFGFIRTGAPLMIYELCFLVVLMTDKIFVKEIRGIDEVGIYTVGLQVGMVVGLLESSVIRAWIPWFFTTLNVGSIAGKRMIAKYSLIYMSILALMAFFWITVSGFIVDLAVDSEYSNAKSVLPWVVVAFFFIGLYKLFAQYLFYEKSTMLLMFISISVAILNIPLTWVMVNQNGIVGAAQATLMSYMFAFLVTLYFSNRRHEIPFMSTIINFWKRRS